MRVPHGSAQRRPTRLEAHLEQRGTVAYAVDSRGIIVAYARTAWNQAAMVNSAPELTRPDMVQGRCLWELIDAKDVRLAYEGFHRLVISGARPRFTTLHRWDHNEAAQQMRVQLSPIELDSGERGVIYESVLLPHVAAAHASTDLGIERARSAAEGRLLRICSYCSFCQLDNGAETAWLPPDAYVARHGRQPAALTHGICPACYEAVVRPQLQAYRPACGSGRRPQAERSAI